MIRLYSLVLIEKRQDSVLFQEKKMRKSSKLVKEQVVEELFLIKQLLEFLVGTAG